jgi:hypothetical protein
MKDWINNIISRYLARKFQKIEYAKSHPYECQFRVFQHLIRTADHTEYGKRFRFQSIQTQEEYGKRVPIVDYDLIKGDINRMMHGSRNILWPGNVKWYSKSSGTTSDKSKYIPVTNENLRLCHIKSSWDSLALLYNNRPDARVFADKNLVMGGSISRFEEYPDTRYGDVSAIMLHHMPTIGRPFYTPDFETALLQDWDEKIEKMARICRHENVTLFGGVPTWTIVLFRRILELT